MKEEKKNQLIFIIKTLYNDLKTFSIFKEASSMAYITMLSLGPSLALSLSFISLNSQISDNENSFYALIKNFILSTLSSSTGNEILKILENFLNNINITKLGLVGLIGLLFTLILMLRSIELTFNKIWKVKQERNFFLRFVKFWSFVTLGTFLGSLIYGYLQNLDAINSVTSLNFLNWTFLLSSLGIFISFFMLFKWGPNCYVQLQSAFIGSLFSSLLFLLMTKIFSLYVSFYYEHNTFYGTITGFPIFLLWLYLCWIIILMGSIISWRAQQKIWKKSSFHIKPFNNQKIRQNRFKTFLPAILLIIIQKKFEQDRLKDLTGEFLHSTLKLPLPWIKESLESLRDLDYIYFKEQDNLKNVENFIDGNIFPKQPTNKIYLKKIFEDILQPVNSWIHSWENELSEDILTIFQTLLEKSHLENLTNETLSDIFKKIGFENKKDSSEISQTDPF